MYFWNSGDNGEDATISRKKIERWNHKQWYNKNIEEKKESLQERPNQPTPIKRLSIKVPDSESLKDEEPNNHGKVMTLVREFAQNTAVPGIGHIYSGQTYLWKAFWLTISLGAATMAIIQSWRILNDFAGGKTIQSTAYSTDFDFPSITVCSNIRLHYRKKGMIEDLDITYLDKDNFTHLLAFMDLLLLKENETGDDPFGPPLTPKSCTYNQISCDKKDPDEIFHFDTPLFGNCFTYNVGTRKPIEGKSNFYLTMKIPMDKFSRRLEWNDNFVLVWLHGPGTAPVLYRHEGIRVYPGDSVDIKFQMKKISRLPRKDSPCLDPITEPKRFASIYYTENVAYLYTSKACAYNLLYEAKKDLYGCMDPAIPRNANWKEQWFTGHYNMCLPGTTLAAPAVDDDDDDDSNSTTFDFDDNCTFPCNEWMVEYTTTSISAWFEAMVDRSLRSTSQDGDLKFENRFAELKIGLGSPMTEEVSEDYKYTIGDFAGILGGNVGIWIGLCMISLAEVVELAIHIVVIQSERIFHKFRQKTFPKQTVQTITVNNVD